MEEEEVIQNQKDLQKEFFEKLSPADRQNLRDFAQLFQSTLKELNLKGALYIVGRILNKTLPRPDIDLAVLLDFTTTYPKQKDFATEYEFVASNFEKIQDIINRIAEKGGFTIIETIEPAIDEEFGSPNILKHSGSIKIAKANSTPFEIINVPQRESYKRVMREEKRPILPLVEVGVEED
jgi:hypothetical protein